MELKNEALLKIVDLIRRLREYSRAAQVDEDYLLVEEARQEWKSAREYFNTVTEPDLIDHAIYALEAAEKRFVYLLKKIREEQVFGKQVPEKMEDCGRTRVFWRG
ncbi:MAG TPA: DUF2508 family protein [Bacillota bacterium]